MKTTMNNIEDYQNLIETLKHKEKTDKEKTDMLAKIRLARQLGVIR
jgi:hypothetical protein